jgi:2'-5' RNA ligase
MALAGVVLSIPEADRVIGRWRRLYDPSARDGMPAHVTLVFPFIQEADRDAAVMERLAAIFAGTSPFELSFSRLARFAETLWLAPEPDGAVRRLIAALVEAFPGHPPYGGAFEDAVPHLTVAQGGRPVLDRVAAALKARMAGPIRSRIVAADVYDQHDAGWRRTARFPLG